MKKKDREKFEHLENKLKSTEILIGDLIDYMQRKEILEYNLIKMKTWQDDLRELRFKEEQERDMHRAKELLKEEGYLVVRNENELDAARLKKWTESKQ